MKFTAKDVIATYRKMFNLQNDMASTGNVLEKCTNKDGKHVNFDKLMESSTHTTKGYSYEFAKDVWEIYLNTDKQTMTINNGFEPKCGFEE